MNTIEFTARSLSDTKLLAENIAKIIKSGDVITLQGNLGAGKTAFSRFLINSFFEDDVEVTSPTFNILHPYDALNFTINHFDLYRIEDESELENIGFFDALGDGVCLIEWPEIANNYLLNNAIIVTISNNSNDNRTISIKASQEHIQQLKGLIMKNRENLLVKFIEKNKLDHCERYRLASDASFRAYERLKNGTKSFMLMDAPPEKEKVKEFISIANYLKNNGFSAPEILDTDIENGFILLEDFGDDSFSAVLSGNSKYNKSSEEELYKSAIEALIELAKTDLKTDLPPYDRAVYMREVKLLSEWYLPYINSDYDTANASKEYEQIWHEILNTEGVEVQSHVILRDYHADNLMWLPTRENTAKVGLLDFQDALLGSPLYDIVSLLEDARRDVSTKTVQTCIDYYLEQNPQMNKEQFMEQYYIIAAQRNCKIIGIFARLAIRDGKQRYMSYLPRVWAHLEKDLQHPALAKLKNWMDKTIPAELRKKDALVIPDELCAVS